VSVIAALLAVAAAAAPAPVTLTVHYRDRAGAVHVAHLRCRGDSARADGYLRASGAHSACRQARKIATFLATRPDPTRICTQIYGGPQRAHVTGTIGARRIDRRFKRTDGCEIDDWQHAVPLVPRVRVGVTP
jgi:hypothetical protein